MSRLRAATRRGDTGITMVELLVSMGIFVVVLSVVLAGLVSMTRSTTRVQDVTNAGDSVRRAFQTLDKQVRYATAVNYPGVGASGAHYVELLTTAVPEGQMARCVQWRVHPTSRQLEVRSWADSPTATRTAWSTVATGVRNDLTSATPNRPFVLRPASGTSLRQQLTVSLDVGRGPAGLNKITGADVRTTFVARNSSHLSQSNADANNDLASDTPVCTSRLERP